MLFKLVRWWTAFLLIPLLYSLAAAQGSASLSPDETIILTRINDSRLRENLVHLVPSATLNRVAETWVEDLASRPIDNLGDVYRTRTGDQTIENLLQREGYESYPSGYVADFVPIVVRDFNPSQIVDFWIDDFRQPEPQLRSRRNVRFNDPQMPLFSALYREIGIAWAFSETTQRHYYVIVFAAQPNVLPVVTTQRGQIAEIVRTFDQRETVLYIHDERVNRFGQGNIIGAVDKLRISEQPGELACADTTSPDWQPYNNEIVYTLSPGAGSKTLYIQMCDAAARSLVSTAQVTLTDPSDDIDLLSIVRATQTAAADATNIAPYQPTIQAILTATATAQITPSSEPD
ncbi:MAG: hypothetical protein CL610_13365 [Anaerolineaceae bacterium]|nr:hypothetical protein [Anaerolineaceae bacterium]